MYSLCQISITIVVMTQLLQNISASGDGKIRRIRHQQHEINRLRSELDALTLQQKTDKILLENLQKVVNNLQLKFENSELELKSNNKESLNSKTDLSENNKFENHLVERLNEKVTDLSDNLKEVIEREVSKEELIIFRQEMEYLRNEVRQLKTTESMRYSNKEKDHQDEVARNWTVHSISRLEETLTEMQREVNLTQSIHQKQEIDSKLEGVREDVSAIRRSLAAVTSRAEGAAATAEMLKQEEERTSGQTHSTAAELTAVSSEVKMLRDDFNQLLDVLPDGIFSKGINITDKDYGNGIKKVQLHERMNQLETQFNFLQDTVDELKLDLPLTDITKKFIHSEDKTNVEPSLTKLKESIRSNTNGLKEIKVSSQQLMAALNSLENKQDKFSAEIRQELAKVEFRMSKSMAEEEVEVSDNTILQDSLSALRSDIRVAMHRIDLLTFKMAAIEEKGIVKDANQIFQSQNLYSKLNKRKHEHNLNKESESFIKMHRKRHHRESIVHQ